MGIFEQRRNLLGGEIDAARTEDSSAPYCAAHRLSGRGARHEAGDRVIHSSNGMEASNLEKSFLTQQAQRYDPFREAKTGRARRPARYISANFK